MKTKERPDPFGTMLFRATLFLLGLFVGLATTIALIVLRIRKG